MSTTEQSSKKQTSVCVIGAGPAGIYAAKQLADDGNHVTLINRDIKPGGLAEYGIFFDKYKMKGGLRKQFRRIMASDNITYYGNVTVGDQGDITLPELQALGFDAIMVAVGAQGTKWLGLPGEQFNGVYHAKDLVYHYNKLPPQSEKAHPFGDRVAIIGAGNVMLDIARWAVRYLKTKEVIIVVRRDPSAVKFTKKEMQSIANNLDLAALDAEIARTAPIMESVGNDPEAAKTFILSALRRAAPKVSESQVKFAFLSQPNEIVGSEDGNVVGLQVENTVLKLRDDGSTSARGMGTYRTLDVDTVVFAIGDTVDTNFGLPIKWGAFIKHETPRFPLGETSYELTNPETGDAFENLFVVGWSREASSGLVGVARKDGISGAKIVAQYLADKQSNTIDHEAIDKLFNEKVADLVTKADWQKLDAVEVALAEENGLEEYKFSSNADMLKVIRQ